MADSTIQVLEGLRGGVTIEESDSVDGLNATISLGADPGTGGFMAKLKWPLIGLGVAVAGFLGWRWWRGRKLRSTTARGTSGLAGRRDWTGHGAKRRRKKSRKAKAA